MAPGIVLETERLVLVPWDDEFRRDHARLAADPDVMRFVGDGAPWPRRRADARCDRMLAHWSEHGYGARAALARGPGRFVGVFEVAHVPEGAVECGPDEIEIGWWLDRAWWGRGLATEAALALRDEAFGRVALERIIGRYRPANRASERIMEKLGMWHERDAVDRYGEPVRISALDAPAWLALHA